ncbi:unnamed protein product [Heterobilharzia americana]|nr:unnamed protein product [Heterobilharzia americana]
MNDIYQCFQMNTIDDVSEDSNLCINDSNKSIKTINPYRKLHNSNSSDMINSFNSEMYYTTSNNKSINPKDELIKCSNDIVESSKLNPILAIASHQWFDRLFHSNSYISDNNINNSNNINNNNNNNNNNHYNQRSYNHHNHHQHTCGLNFESTHDHLNRIRLNSYYSEYSQHLRII